MKTLDLSRMESFLGGQSQEEQDAAEKKFCIGVSAMTGGMIGGPAGFFVGIVFGAAFCGQQ